MDNNFTLEELKEQFCTWHCPNKNQETAIDNPYEPICVEVNGEEVWSENNQEPIKVNLCVYCQINDFLYYLRR